MPLSKWHGKGVFTAALMCAVSPVALANPVGGVVVGGSATITAPSPTKLDIHQTSDKAVIDWRGFDIGAGEHTQFYQPNGNAMVLNRVNDTKASVIDGMLTANGRVFVVNQNGVLFGKNSKVDVNGLVATTADIDNDKFMAGNLVFDKPGKPDATIENRGTITAKQAGLVGLVAPNVINSGVITARLGTVQLASGSKVTLDLYGDKLMEVSVDDAVTSQLVQHSGRIEADGGTIALTAAAGREVVDSLVNVSGELRARTVGNRQGRIIIAAEGSHAVAGNVAAEKDKKTGVSTVLVTAKIDVSSADGNAGHVTITGDRIALLDGTVIDASGATAGGTVHVGGQYLGQGATPRRPLHDHAAGCAHQRQRDGERQRRRSDPLCG